MRTYIITDLDNWEPEDKTGEYCLKFPTREIYYKDNMLHRLDGPAVLWYKSAYYGACKKIYWLENKLYGNESTIPDDQYWIKYQKLKAFE